MLKTRFIIEFHNFHALTEGYFWVDRFNLDDWYAGLIPIMKLWLMDLPSGCTISLRWMMLRYIRQALRWMSCLRENTFLVSSSIMYLSFRLCILKHNEFANIIVILFTAINWRRLLNQTLGTSKNTWFGFWSSGLLKPDESWCQLTIAWIRILYLGWYMNLWIIWIFRMPSSIKRLRRPSPDYLYEP